MDFIIDLGKENSRVLVHEYYDTFKFIESRNELKVDPNKINVEKNGQGFSVVKLYYKEKVIQKLLIHLKILNLMKQES